jgi:hypothetical protein
MDNRRPSIIGQLLTVGFCLLYWKEILVLALIGLVVLGPPIVGAFIGSVLALAFTGDSNNPHNPVLSAFMVTGAVVATIVFWIYITTKSNSGGKTQPEAFLKGLADEVARCTQVLVPDWQAKRFADGSMLFAHSERLRDDVCLYVKVYANGLTVYGHISSAGEGGMELGRAKFSSHIEALARLAAFGVSCANIEQDPATPVAP